MEDQDLQVLTQNEALCADIDLRMGPEWLTFVEHLDDEERENAIRRMRAAFATGYCEAYRDPRPGSLCTDHGYTVPTRTSA